MSLWLGIDVGTSSTKAILIGRTGRIAGMGSQSYPLHSIRPGWNEQDPEDWWKGAVQATRKALRSSGVKASQIRGIGLSGQMHGSVFLDRNGAPIRRALLWNDQRTVAECREITEAVGGRERLISLVSNDALTGFTAPKILWLRNHEPARYRKLAQVLLPKDFVRFRMTGGFATDVSDASGTLLLDVAARKWSEPVLRDLKIDPSVLPPLFESAEVTGSLSLQGARELGLVAGIPVVAGAGDQPAGAIGMGVVEEGTVSATLGTSGVVFACVDRPAPNRDGVLQSFCHAIPGKWCVFGCMLTAGGALEWLKEALYPASAGFPEILAAASRALPGSRGLVFLPYLDGERCPHPDPRARGSFVGLTRLHGLGEISRSVIEGVTYGMKDQIELIRDLSPVREVRLGGGGAKNAFWRQLQADVYDAETVAVNTEDAAAFGAAILAGVGTGAWGSIGEACRKSIRLRSRCKPKAGRAEFHAKRHRLYQRLYRDLRPSFEDLAELQ